MSDLATFLQEQQTGMFDSTGAFTISTEKALEKLAQSQLPHPAYWVLKIAQFAAASEVRSVIVTVGRRITRLAMELPRPVSIAQLQAGLNSVDPLPDRALEHLVTGLRAVAGVADRRFALHLMDRTRSQYLTYDGEQLSSEFRDVSSPLVGLILEVTTRVGVRSVVDALIDRRVQESSALTGRAFTVPFRLNVDGRELKFGPLGTPTWFTQHLCWNFVQDDNGMSLPSSLLPDRKVRVSAFWMVTYNYVLRHRALALTADALDQESPSTLSWLKDGVIVKTERLVGPASAFSLALYVDAQDCPADLGGLNLRNTKSFQAKRVWVRDLLKHIDQTTCQRIGTINALSGKSLGGWRAFLASSSHLPMTASLKYDKPGLVANQLSAHPRFRKRLLKDLKNRAQERLLGLAGLRPFDGRND